MPVAGSAGVAGGGVAGAAGASVGGYWNTGGVGLTPEQKCVADKTTDPVTKNVAKQTGYPLSMLVKKVCADPAVQEMYQ